MDQPVIKVKDMLGDNWIPKLKERTGKSKRVVHYVVTQEKYSHEIWPAVLQLAKEVAEMKKQTKELLQDSN